MESSDDALSIRSSSPEDLELSLDNDDLLMASIPEETSIHNSFDSNLNNIQSVNDLQSNQLLDDLVPNEDDPLAYLEENSLPVGA